MPFYGNTKVDKIKQGKSNFSLFFIFIVMNLKENIKRILREETTTDYTSLIETILTNLFVNDHKDKVCSVKVVNPREQMQLYRPEQYSVIIYFKGLDFKFLPKSNLKEELMNEAWDLVYNYTGQKISMFGDYVKDCSDIIPEDINRIHQIMTEDKDSYVSRKYYDQEYEKEYPKWGKLIIKLLEKDINSYAEINDGNIIVLLNDKNLDKNLIKYDKINEILWYDYSLQENLESYMPYGSRHFKYAVQDFFKKHFPQYGVRELTAANLLSY